MLHVADLPSLSSLNYTLALIALIGVPAAAWRSKTRRRLSASADAILGEEAETDRAGNVITPARPGLVHRVSTVEDALVRLADDRTRTDEVAHRVDELAHAHAELTRRVTVLETSRVERIATHAESAQMWRAVAERDTAPTDD